MLRSTIEDYSQRVLIEKINRFQSLKGRPLISTRGYCHGLAVAWLAKAAQQKVDWFYRTVKYIIDTPPEEYDELLFEKFLAQIEFGQNPIHSGMNITHRHLRILLEMNNIESIGFSGSHFHLYRRIRPKKYPAMYLVASSDHAIAVFHRGDEYHVYDSNYVTGEAMVFHSNQEAAAEIMARLLSEEKRAEEGDFELELNYIPLDKYMSHPAVETLIDMPAEAMSDEADKSSSNHWGVSTCHLL